MTTDYQDIDVTNDPVPPKKNFRLFKENTENRDFYFRFNVDRSKPEDVPTEMMTKINDGLRAVLQHAKEGRGIVCVNVIRDYLLNKEGEPTSDFVVYLETMKTYPVDPEREAIYSNKFQDGAWRDTNSIEWIPQSMLDGAGKGSDQ